LSRPRVLLLNPPGDKLYIRDYYCSKVSKTYYLPQPVDLLIQSSFFSEDKYELKVIDSIASKWNAQQTIVHVQAFKPDVVIGLMGAVSLPEDEEFYVRLHEQIPEAHVFLSGDALLEAHDLLLEKYTWLTGIVTNFFNGGVEAWMRKEASITGLVYKSEHGIVHAEQERNSVVELETPKQALFPKKPYRMPFSNAEPIATVLTNYACPYPCTFCIMSTLPYMTRSAESIIEELKYLKANGYKYIYFSDQTFFMNKSITRQVLNWMIESDYGMNWMCFSRVDVLGPEELRLMKNAGCNLIMFGVEWAEDKYLKQYKKNYTLDQIRTTFKLSKEMGIKRLGTFLIGVPGQSASSIWNTVEFAKELNADYASFNVAVPRSNTAFRDEAIDLGIIDESVRVMDQSGDEITMGTGLVSREELERLKKKAYRSFYFRPQYVIKRLFSIRSKQEFINHVREGAQLLK